MGSKVPTHPPEYVTEKPSAPPPPPPPKKVHRVPLPDIGEQIAHFVAAKVRAIIALHATEWDGEYVSTNGCDHWRLKIERIR